MAVSSASSVRTGCDSRCEAAATENVRAGQIAEATRNDAARTAAVTRPFFIAIRGPRSNLSADTGRLSEELNRRDCRTPRIRPHMRRAEARPSRREVLLVYPWANPGPGPTPLSRPLRAPLYRG